MIQVPATSKAGLFRKDIKSGVQRQIKYAMHDESFFSCPEQRIQQDAVEEYYVRACTPCNLNTCNFGKRHVIGREEDKVFCQDGIPVSGASFMVFVQL